MADQLPPDDAVRIEDDQLTSPGESRPVARRGEPLAVHTELTPALWNADRLLLRVGVRAMDAVRSELPPANLVFLVDVSGSMTAANKLPLLTERAAPADRYPASAGPGLAGDPCQRHLAVLPPTPAVSAARSAPRSKS